ncbi:MAG: carbohydrate binding family 9 domain-containing protein [Acidobacteria bacterium]|nr:carbohydrate binding family 9 domain-containing protein [Acidobacteriota bacterium]
MRTLLSKLLMITLVAAPAFFTEARSIPVSDLEALLATRVSEVPVIDGRLTEAIWRSATPISGFTQREPDEGEPATEPTSVYVAYDDAALYIAARMEDSGAITTRLGRRDGGLESDWFRVWLDPHYDRQTGVAFWVNPSNVQIDMVLYNDGWDDWDWDAVWESATQIEDGAWTVEMRIPYSQLRFPDREEHVWGVNFGRRIHRLNEETRLVHIPRTETGFVSRFADLVGISGIHPARSLEIVPYVVGRSDLLGTVSSNDPLRSDTEHDATAGVDVKYSLSSNLTLTGTINPDFGQVEVDPAVVNLSQFEQFFPEKRPFFIEGANLFGFGRGGSNNNFGFNLFEPSFFYSRRIGRNPQATGLFNADYVDAPGESTILGAAKITGKFGDGWSIGVLDALTDKENATFQIGENRFSRTVEPMTNYLVGRMAKDFGEKSRVGMLFTAVNRDLDENLRGALRSDAYSGGIDGYRFFGDKDVVWEWFVGGSHVQGSEEAITATQRSPARYFDRPDADHVELDPSRTSLSGWAANTMLAKQTGNWRYNVKVQAYSPGFETNDVGFMTRTDVIASHAALMWRNPEPDGFIRDRNAWIAKFQNWNFAGDKIADGIYGRGSLRFDNYWYTFGSGGYDFETEDDRLTRGGPVALQPTAYRLNGGFGSDSRKPVFFELWGGGWRDAEGGKGSNLGLQLTWRPTSNLSLNVVPTWSESHGFAQYVRRVGDGSKESTYGNRYIFGEIDRETVELGTRVDWTFSSKLSLQLYVQPFIASGDYSRFKELDRPRSLDYFVYGEDGGTITFDETENRYTVDPDASGNAPAFAFGNPDFNFRSVRGSAVLRWEFRPGSAVFFVWNENRADVEQVGDFRMRRDFDAIVDAPSDDVFLIKFSYWLAM